MQDNSQKDRQKAFEKLKSLAGHNYVKLTNCCY
jgi:hypothetical protein